MYEKLDYAVGSMLWVSRSILFDAYAMSPISDRLCVRRFGLFSGTDFVGKNVVRFELRTHFKIYRVVSVIYTTLCFEQLLHMFGPIPSKPEPVPKFVQEHHAENILSQFSRGLGLWFLTVMERCATRGAEWKPMKGFVNRERTATKV